MKAIYLILAGATVLGLATYIVYKRNHTPALRDTVMTFNENIIDLTLQNDFFRKELITGKHSQVVIMSIPVGGDIGTERHTVDQTLIFVQGHGQAIINGVTSEVAPNTLVFVSAGAEHNFKNTGTEPLKLFTIYAPPQHKPGTIHTTKPAVDVD